MPPLIGWVAATGKLSFEAWVLYVTLFLWQFPHFMAIAWMYREDYARAGYLVLFRGQQSGRFMSWQALVASLALIPVSLSPVISGAGPVYCAVAIIVSSGFFYYSARLAFQRSNVSARRVLMASTILKGFYRLLASGSSSKPQ
jgi:heme o synthase